MPAKESWSKIDPRYYQLAALSALLIYGLAVLDFDMTPARSGLILTVCMAAQWLFSKLFNLPAVEYKSALISGLSLCLLLRTNQPALAVAGALLAIASKFLLRFNNRHLFNPTNGALVFLLLLFPDQTWVSPAQWGNVAFFSFLMLSVGAIVVNRAARWDVTVAFLSIYIALILSRSYWLNEPWAIPLHKLKNGGLLLFAFFMISDPKTTPNSRPGRILFAFLVAFGAAWIQFRLFRNNGLLWSLAAFSLAVPLINYVFPGQKYAWQQAKSLTTKINENTGTNPGGAPFWEPLHNGVLRLLRRESRHKTI